MLLPAWYSAKQNPPIPLIISPHGRGRTGRDNVAIWGNLPTHGAFAVVNPDGQGRRLSHHSWGFAGQIDDLARMPQIVQRELPWVRVDRTQIYAFGGSMGGQETLLLLARYPRLLAGAAVFSSVVDLARQYHGFPRIVCGPSCQRIRGRAEPLGRVLQKLARQEMGGSPQTRPAAYVQRSPLTYVQKIAFSCVPLQIWWSVSDRIVIDQQKHSGRLFWEIRRLNPAAPVQGFVGFWIHSSEMRARSRLPDALANFGLAEAPSQERGPEVRIVPQPLASAECVPER